MRITREWLVLPVAFALATDGLAQCRLDPPWRYGVAAIENGRAVVSENVLQNPVSIPIVHFLQKSPQGWLEESSFVLGDYQFLEVSPVALDGDRGLAGAPEVSGMKGRAFVFDRVGGQWVATELIRPAIQFGDYFGCVADLDGDVAVVGANHWALAGGDGIGRVHVFELQAGAWTQVTELMIVPWAVQIEGSTIVVDCFWCSPGRVEVYERIGGSWVLTQTIPGGGRSIALQGDTLVVGSGSSGAHLGYVDVFRRVSGTWQPVQHIVPSGSDPYGGFGEGVALSGSTLLVGAPYNQSRVYRFEHDGTAYVERSVIGPEPGIGSFGWSLAVDGEDAFIGGFPNGHLYRLGFAETSSFCPATPNSTGARGILRAEGCDSRSGASLTLVASHLPPGAIGFAFLGLNTAQQPFGDGTLCIGAARHRLPVSVADDSGRMVHEVDFGSSPGSLLAAGRTWKFQTVFRDPASAGARLNLTNALAIPITP